MAENVEASVVSDDALEGATEIAKVALEAGMAALRWLVAGYGYEITGLDVLNAAAHTMKAARNAGCVEQTQNRIRDLVARESFGERFVTKVLGRQLGL